MSWSFFEHQAFRGERAISRYAQRRVVIKAASAASLEMFQTEFLLELLIIALNTPAQFCKPYHFLDWGCRPTMYSGSTWLARLLPWATR